MLHFTYYFLSFALSTLTFASVMVTVSMFLKCVPSLNGLHFPKIVRKLSRSLLSLSILDTEDSLCCSLVSSYHIILYHSLHLLILYPLLVQHYCSHLLEWFHCLYWLQKRSVHSNKSVFRASLTSIWLLTALPWWMNVCWCVSSKIFSFILLSHLAYGSHY